MKPGDIESIQKKLPSVPRLEGEDEYLTSVVLLLLVTIDGELNIVFEKRSPSIRQGGEISLPGGRVDLGDGTLEFTAKRETSEEIGIRVERLRILGRLDSVLAPIGAMVHVFVGFADVNPDEFIPNSKEVASLFFVPLSFFTDREPEIYEVISEVHPYYIDPVTGAKNVLFPTKELGLPERYWNSWGGSKHKVYVYRTNGGTIWGITARIIRDFASKLKK